MDAPQAPSIAISDVSLNTAAGLSAVAGGSEQVQTSIAAVVASAGSNLGSLLSVQGSSGSDPNIYFSFL